MIASLTKFHKNSVPQASKGIIRYLFCFFVIASVLICGSYARAQTAPTQDALWAWGFEDGALGVCFDPSSQTSIDNCFSDYSTSTSTRGSQLIATDGVSVYAATENDGWGYKCPLTGPGSNNSACKKILIGSFDPNNYGKNKLGVPYNSVTSIAVGNGYIWTAQFDGSIWRCLNDIPWSGSIPSTYSEIESVGCVQLDTSGNPGTDIIEDQYRYPSSLVLVGETLYAGLTSQTISGLLWSCDSMTVNACKTLDEVPSKVHIASMTAGAGYLWVSRTSDFIIWRCDLNVANSCSNWNKAGNYGNFLSYGGQGILAVGISYLMKNPAVLWSCKTSNSNACTTLISERYGSFSGVAAGGTRVWGAYTKTDYKVNFISMNSEANTYAKFSSSGGPNLLYIPAGGPTTLGSTRIKIPATGSAAVLLKICNRKNDLRAEVSIQGPYGKIERILNLCKSLNASPRELEFQAMDPGWYRVSVKAGHYKYSKRFYLQKNEKMKEITVNLWHNG